MRKDKIFLEKNNDKEDIMLERLEKIAEFAGLDLKELGFEEYEVKDVECFNEEVELINKKTGKPEKFKLYLAITENSKAKKDEEAIFEIEYLVKDDKVYTINDLILEYEGFENIKDVMERARENEKLPEKKQDERFKIHRLSEEREKALEKEQKGKNNKDEKEHEVDDDELINDKEPKNVWQVIDVDKAYVEEWKTVRRAFRIPPGVRKLVVAKTMKNDTNALAPDMTIYMLDDQGNIIEEANGKTIKDIFKIDRAAGRNSVDNTNTQFNLENDYAEREEGQILRSFQSINNKDLYLYTNQKVVGEYPEVCVGKKSLENNFVGVQLETHNVEMQHNLTPQENLRGTKGIYHAEKVDEEVEQHMEHGDDGKEIELENADGDERTIEICDSPYIPGTEITWKELSETTGEGITKLQERFERETEQGKDSKEIIGGIIADYNMINDHTPGNRRR